MVVEASGMFNMSHKFDDEDGPMTFKRRSASKTIQLHSDIRKSTSLSHSGQSYKKTSHVPSSNGQISCSKNGKVVPSAKASAAAVESSNASTSNLKFYTRCEDSEDEEDNIPLSARMKVNNDNAKKATPNVLKKSSDDDDDDDVPLSARIFLNKPLSKVQKYGPNAIIKQERTSTLSVKRLLDKIDSLHSSCKKPKLSDQASSINAKQVSLKSELKVEEEDDDDDDDIPLCQRMNKFVTLVDKSSSSKKLAKVNKLNKAAAPSFKKKAKFKKSANKSVHSESTELLLSSDDGQKKWTTLAHNGVVFPPPYKPHGVMILYKGKSVSLTPEQEEVATMFALMRDTDHMQKELFKYNFWNDWRKLLGKNHVIQNLEDCDFTPIYNWCQNEKDKKKQMSSEEKKALREEKMKQEEKYMWAIVDGVEEKTGKVKRRIGPNDVIINIGKDAPVPECPIPGESWKEIIHDDTGAWLAKWYDPINTTLIKYVSLAASSSWKGQSDKEKYEKARMLKNYIGNIRAAYTKGFASKDITKKQIAVATYFIDKLALRAGNEKVIKTRGAGNAGNLQVMLGLDHPSASEALD